MMMPMQFLFGLGNPGEKYQHTRHNVGFVLIDEVVRQHLAKNTMGNSGEFRLQPKLHAEILKHEDLVFVKPQTFMNDSGLAARAVVEYFDKTTQFTPQSQLKNIWVIHDDLDIEVGKYKIQFGTGPKVHNGLGSIDDHFHTENYWHVRVGVDGRQGDRSLPPHEYVLGRFSPQEKTLLDQVMKELSVEVLRRLAEPI